MNIFGQIKKTCCVRTILVDKSVVISKTFKLVAQFNISCIIINKNNQPYRKIGLHEYTGNTDQSQVQNFVI